MNNFKKPKTLKVHLWLYFCTFAVAIMAILWILQILFLGAFFNSMKLNEMKKVGRLIEQQYDVNDENFYNFWFEHSFKSGMFAHLVTENGDVVRNFNSTSDFKTRSEFEMRNSDERSGFRGFGGAFVEAGELKSIIAQVNTSKKAVSFTGKDDTRGAKYAVYASHLGKRGEENIYLMLVSPLERTDSTRKVLETQLMIATVISIFLALLLAYFIARRISKPIENTTLSAKKLAQGDFGVRFSGEAYSEIDELANVLNNTASELSKTEELRRDLISNVSHDLRTPLTIIKSYAELIRDISGSNEEKRLKHTGVIIEETNNLALLVNDMLDLSKIQSGTVTMNISSFDLVALISSTVSRFEYYRENCGINFVVKTGDFDSHVFGDEKRIEQVMYNLIANAVNYTGDDGLVEISLADEGERTEVRVRDTGFGISEDDLERVWDKYYKASGKHRRDTVGTGIGLSIVKNILISHGASFGVESVRGQGTVFKFCLNKVK